jgi:hypothetical protein
VSESLGTAVLIVVEATLAFLVGDGSNSRSEEDGEERFDKHWIDGYTHYSDHL